MITFTPESVIRSAELNANFSGLADGSEILDGAITIPKISNPYKFLAYRATSNQTISNATWTTVALNGEDFDTNNNFDTSTYKYTVPITGYYLLVGQMYAQDADSGYSIIIICKNATSGVTGGFVLAEQRIVTTAGSHNKPNNCSYFGQLTAGDTITLVAYISDTTTPSLLYKTATTYGTFLSGYLVSET